MTPDKIEKVVAEARSWLRTPYVHRGAIKGVGADCGMLLIEVYGNALDIPKPDPGNYSPDWYLHRDEPIYLQWLSQYADRLAEDVEPCPGDIVMFKFGRHAAHGGIVVEPGLMVHAYRPHGNVELAEIRHFAARSDGQGRLDSAWRVR